MDQASTLFLGEGAASFELVLCAAGVRLRQAMTWRVLSRHAVRSAMSRHVQARPRRRRCRRCMQAGRPAVLLNLFRLPTKVCPSNHDSLMFWHEPRAHVSVPRESDSNRLR